MTLRHWRVKGTGPDYVRMGRAIRYEVKDLDAWMARHKQTAYFDKPPKRRPKTAA